MHTFDDKTFGSKTFGCKTFCRKLFKSTGIIEQAFGLNALGRVTFDRQTFDRHNLHLAIWSTIRSSTSFLILCVYTKTSVGQLFFDEMTWSHLRRKLHKTFQLLPFVES